jgi:hypothetical protein
MHNFSKNFPYLDISELIQYIGVFDGYSNLEYLHRYESLVENIEVNILGRYTELKSQFIFSSDEKVQLTIEKLLYKLAIGDRKIYSSTSLYQTLIEKNIIQKELTREKPLREYPHQKIKKEFRNYQVENKALFTKDFYRFWFTFVAPNQDKIEKKDFKSVVQKIEDELDKYISRTFEKLANRLLIAEIGVSNITESGSYWDKHIELDLLIKAKNSTTIAGEVKYKNQKISKNTLNKLQKKCQKANIAVNYFALFSKSGFSNELLKNRDQNILLYDINSFKRLVDG